MILTLGLIAATGLATGLRNQIGGRFERGGRFGGGRRCGLAVSSGGKYSMCEFGKIGGSSVKQMGQTTVDVEVEHDM